MPQFTHLPPQFTHRSPQFRHRPDPIRLAIMLFAVVFWAAAVTCFLLAAHRIARGLRMSGRAAALDAAGDAMTDEEKRTVAEYLRRDALQHV
jgi:hypothetical protein